MVSVVIPAYNEEKQIQGCLEAMSRQRTKEAFEVILVNNDSTDHTEEIAWQYANALRMKILREPQRGAGAARATGFREAKGEIVLSTDADTEVPPHWIDSLIRPFANPKVVAVTGTCRIQDCSRFTNAMFNVIQPVSMRLYRLVFGHYWLTGSNFGVRRSIYEESGGFDATISFQEDLDLGFRIRKFGKIYFLPHVSVLTSGRRFKRHLVLGFGVYVVKFLEIFVFRRR